MQPLFTEDVLILYIYNELDDSQRAVVQQAIDTDAGIRQMFADLLEVIARLNPISMEPDQTSIDVIMEHAHFDHYEEHSH